MAQRRTEKKPTFKDVEKVVRELVLPFYAIERAIPILSETGRRRENDAEHSWNIALIASMLAPHIDPTLDVGKVCQFAIVHDLTEVYAGDTSAFAEEPDHQTKEEREHAALERIKKEFAHFPWLVAMVEAYERQDTPEAHYVRSIDKYVPLIFDYVTDGDYYHEHKHTIEDFMAFMERPREKAKIHPGAFAYHEEAMALLLASPHLFHRPHKRK